MADPSPVSILYFKAIPGGLEINQLHDAFCVRTQKRGVN